MLPPSLRAETFPATQPVQPSPASKDTEAVTPLWRVERDAIETAIALCEGNIPKAAAMLEISPSTIYRKKMVWDKHPPAPYAGAGGAGAHF